MTQEEQLQVLDAARRLLAAASEQKGAQHVVDVAHEILGLPITVGDLVFNTVAQNLEGIDPAKLIPSSDDISGFRGWMRTVMSSEEPVIDESGAFYRAMCYDIRLSGATVGRITIYETRPFVPTDSEILKQLSAALSCVAGMEPLGNLNLPNQAFSNLMLDLIEGRIDTAGVQRAQEVFSIPAEGDRWVLTMRDMERDTIEYPMIQSRCYHQLGGHTVSLGDTLVCLLETKPDPKRIEAFLAQGHLRGGLSRRFSRLTDLTDYYLQAIFAMARAEKEKKALADYGECLAADVVDHCGRDRDLTTFCRPEVLTLWEYDKEHGTEYVKTLECYCQNLCSVSDTARDLFVHYNTIKYRMNTIRELCGLGELRGEDIFELWLSFRALEAGGQAE